MKMVVIGDGPIGSKLVTMLAAHGHEAAADTGVDILTGEGLADALAQATVVIDVSNPPSAEGAAALEFFQTATRNLLAAEAAAGVGHHVALSAVGIELLQHSGYFQAKRAQEKLIENSAVPYSIVQATQFYEYLPIMAAAATDGSTIRFAPVLFQPIAEDDAVHVLGQIAAGSPLNGKVELAGPERFRMDEFFRSALAACDDPRTVVTDSRAGFLGAELGVRTLLPGADAVLGGTSYRNWPGHGHAYLRTLEGYVRTELTRAQTSLPDEDAVSLPIEEWLSDPADDQRYEASLRSLLGAVEALEDGSYPEPGRW